MAYFIMPGDAKELLKGIPDNSIDSFVMDPPYDLTSIQKRFGAEDAAPAKDRSGGDGPFTRTSRGFMGKTWDGTGVAFDKAFWKQVVRVLKPGGHVAAFGGSRTYHRMAVAMEDAGLEIRDSLFWVYGSGFPKSHDISKAIDKKAGAEREVIGYKVEPDGRVMGKEPLAHERVANPQDKIDRKFGADNRTLSERKMLTAPATQEAEAWDGWGTALKPAQEPIVLARKPISESSVAANVLRWGTGAINIGATRVNNPGPHGTAGRMKFDGFNPTGSTYMVKGHNRKSPPNESGRWPANVLLTCCGMVPHREGCPIRELDRQSGSSTGAHGGKRNRVGSIWGNGKTEAPSIGKDNQGGASRFYPNLEWDADLDDLVPFFYTAKASRAERDLGLDDLEAKAAHELVDRKEGTAGLNSPRAGAGRTSGGRNTHPTVKPIKLMEWLIKLITPPGGTIVDCFMGSGTTGMAAVLNGFDFIGMELTDEYIPIAMGRIGWAAEQAEAYAKAPKQATIFNDLEAEEGGDTAGEDLGRPY